MKDSKRSNKCSECGADKNDKVTLASQKVFDVPDRETFLSLLFAAYNIGEPGEVDPETGFGWNYNTGALKAANMVYDLMAGKRLGTVQGVLTAVRLLAETTCAKNPQAYAEVEIERGLTNCLRVEDNGASIKLPSDVETPIKETP